MTKKDKEEIVENEEVVESTKAEEISVEEEPKEEKKAMKVTDLPGVGAATAEKLETVGFTDLMSLAVATPGEVVEASGVSEAVAKKIIAASRANLDMGFESGEDVLKKRDLIIRTTTGSRVFDDLMGGGFESGAITECFGEFGSGKTQIGHLLAVNCQKDDPTAIAVYIDTENTFRPERIVTIAKAHGMDPEKVLDRIMVARAYNSAHQTLILEEASHMIQENNIKLLIVDSAVGLFRAEYLGRGTLSVRQQRLNKFVHLLVRIAETYNCAALATNQVMASPDVFFGDPTRPIGGNVVAHTSTYRIYFKKSGKKRIARMVDSPHHPEQEVIFTLGEAGVLDPDPDTKKKSAKSAKPSKLEAETKSDAKDAPESDSSVDVDSKTDNLPEDSE